MSIFKKIGEFFKGLFNAAKKTWNRLSPEVQEALQHGSGIVAIINQNIDATPDFVLEAILKRFPELTEEKIKDGLTKVAEELKILQGVNDPDLPTLLKNLQVYLGSLSGKGWAVASHLIASAFAIITAPAGTKFAAITSLIEWVYQTFFYKPKA